MVEIGEPSGIVASWSAALCSNCGVYFTRGGHALTYEGAGHCVQDASTRSARSLEIPIAQLLLGCFLCGLGIDILGLLPLLVDGSLRKA